MPLSMAVAVMLDRSHVYTFCSGVVRRIRQQTTNDNKEKGEKDREREISRHRLSTIPANHATVLVLCGERRRPQCARCTEARAAGTPQLQLHHHKFIIIIIMYSILFIVNCVQTHYDAKNLRG